LALRWLSLGWLYVLRALEYDFAGNIAQRSNLMANFGFKIDLVNLENFTKKSHISPDFHKTQSVTLSKLKPIKK